MDNYNKLPSNISLYLSSDSSLDYYYDNKSYNFSNKLINHLDSENYSIGLSEIYYGDSLTEPSSTSTTTTTTETPISMWFSPSIPKNDTIVLKRQTELRNETKVRGLNLTEFLIQLDLDLKTKIPSAKVKSLQVDGKRKTIIIFEDKTLDGYKLELMPELSQFLGFSETEFAPGTHTSSGYQDIEIYNKYSNMPSAWIRSYKYHESSLPIGSGDEDTLDDVFLKASDLLKMMNYLVSFVVSPDGRSLHVEIDTPRLGVKLPDYINRAIGLSEDQWLDKTQTIILPVVKDDIPLDLVTVLCNIVNPSQFGNKLVPLLRVFPRAYGILSRHHFKFSPVQFFHQKDNHCSNFINIQLQDQFGNYLPETKFQTVVILHLKKN